MPHQCGADHHIQRKLTALNTSCRLIKSTKVDLYLLSGIAPLYIRRTVPSQLEKLKQEIDPCYPLYSCEPMAKKLKPRQLFTLSQTTEQESICPYGAATLRWDTGSLSAPLTPVIPGPSEPV